MKRFYVLLGVVAVFGLLLRLIDYDRVPPFGVTQDEFFYPWAGMTLLTTGVPKAWSLFSVYPQAEVEYTWGIRYPLVSPWIEKPPLYVLLAGVWMLIAGVSDLFDVRLSTLRLLPIGISVCTIVLTGLLARTLFGNAVGLLAAILYATTPTIVLANRVSVVENLMAPLIVASAYVFMVRRWNLLLLSGLLGLLNVTKNIGISITFAIVGALAVQRDYRYALKVLSIAMLFALIHPLMGFYFGWNLFTSVLKEYQHVHALAGLPELIGAIFRFPMIGHQWDRMFPDGPMLIGYILLFSAPWWLGHARKVLVWIPFAYLGLLALLESGGTQYSYFGWHVYPVFPFLMILLSSVMYSAWKGLDFLQLEVLFVILGSSTVRFFLLLVPELQEIWQYILLLVIGLPGVIAILQKRYLKILLLGYFILFCVVNVFLVMDLNRIYPGGPQPVN